MNFWLYLCRAWQRGRFGRSTDVSGAIKHLEREVKELSDPFADRTEYADAVFLVWQIAHRRGVSPLAFMSSLWRKLYINVFEREWEEPVDGEPCEHVRKTPLKTPDKNCAEAHGESEHLARVGQDNRGQG